MGKVIEIEHKSEKETVRMFNLKLSYSLIALKLGDLK
jgi:hypothetical protein